MFVEIPAMLHRFFSSSKTCVISISVVLNPFKNLWYSIYIPSVIFRWFHIILKIYINGCNPHFGQIVDVGYPSNLLKKCTFRSLIPNFTRVIKDLMQARSLRFSRGEFFVDLTLRDPQSEKPCDIAFLSLNLLKCIYFHL